MKSYLITTPPGDSDSPALKLFIDTLGCHCLPLKEQLEGGGFRFRFIVTAEESVDVQPGRIGADEARRLQREIENTLLEAVQANFDSATVYLDPRLREKADRDLHRLEIGTSCKGSIFNPLTVGFVERHLPRILDRLGRLGFSVRPAPAGFYECPIVGVDFFITEDGGALTPFDIEAGAKSAEC